MLRLYLSVYEARDFSIYGYPITFFDYADGVNSHINALTTRSREQEKLRHEAAQSKLRADLLRAISHDLRTPLTSIIGVIDTVMNEDEHLSHEDRVELLKRRKAGRGMARANGGEPAFDNAHKRLGADKH